MADISTILTQMEAAELGAVMLPLITAGMTAINIDAVLIAAQQTALEDQFIQVIQGATETDPSSVEIETARGGFGALYQRLNSSDADLADIVQVLDNTMTQAQIQTAINTYKHIKFKTGTYDITINAITGIGLSCGSGKIIDFEPGAILQAIGCSNSTYMIFNLSSVSDIVINNINIVGERTTHVGTSGEWGFGLFLNGTSNITLNRPTCSNCWGDGIILGSLGGVTNENIIIESPICENNRRQGISIISAKNLLINNPVLTNTNGASPEAGIDFEPDNAVDYMENIRIVNPRTSGNYGAGILVALGPLSNTARIADIKIDNHRDDGSNSGVMLGGTYNLKGKVEINNPLWINSNYCAFIAENHVTTSPLVLIKSPVIINPHRTSNGTLLANEKWGSVISIFREAEDTITQPLGNIIIDDLIIQNTDVTCYANVSTYDTTPGLDTKSILVRNPLAFGLAGRNILSNTNLIVVSGYKVLSTLAVGVINETATVIDNTGAIAQSDLYIATTMAIGSVVTVEIVVAQKLRIYIFTDVILNLKVAGQVLSSATRGSKITIEKIAAGEWVARSIIGTWTEELA